MLGGIRMIVTNSLKKRFCKDYCIPIKIYEEPYFTNRLKLLEPYYGSYTKYQNLLELASKIETEDDFFLISEQVKDDIVTSIRNTNGFKNFDKENPNKFKITNQGFNTVDLYDKKNDGLYFISIDLIKANFVALRHYDTEILSGIDNYENFIRKFTEEKYFIHSKCMRQVIFGNLNPKLQSVYEKYLMDKILTNILKIFPPNKIYCFLTDEIVVRTTKANMQKDYSLLKDLIENLKKENITARVDLFQLLSLGGVNGFMKKHVNENKIDFKCIDSLYLPYVIKKINNEPIQEEDLMFYHDNILVKMVNEPNITIPKCLKNN